MSVLCIDSNLTQLVAPPLLLVSSSLTLSPNEQCSIVLTMGSHSTSQPHLPPQNSPSAPAAVELPSIVSYNLSNSTVQPQSPTNI